MKLSTRDGAQFLRSPDRAMAGALIYGADPMRVSDARIRLTAALAGPDAEKDMRLTRMLGAGLKSDPAALLDSLKAVGFFPGDRVTVVEEANDNSTDALKTALAEWQQGDGYLIVTAGQLTPRSSLRKLFEGAKNAGCIALYDQPLGREDLQEALAAAGVSKLARDGEDALFALTKTLEPGDVRQTVEKLGLYMIDDDRDVTAADVEAVAPRSSEADLDDLIGVVADGQASSIGPLLQKLYAQGVLPTRIAIDALRQFRRLHQAASDPGGAAAGVGRLKPPVFGPRRDQMVRRAGNWGSRKLEDALTALLDADLTLRSGADVPAAAMMERTLIRLAMMARR